MADPVVISLLIVACIAVLADAWATKRGLTISATEKNPVRRFFIRLFGINGGTYGVAVAICAALVFSYSPQSNVAGISYATVACAYIYVVFNNLQTARRLSK